MKLTQNSIALINSAIKERNAKRIAGKRECQQRFSSRLILGLFLFSDAQPHLDLRIYSLIFEMLQPSVIEAQNLMRVCRNTAFFGKKVINDCVKQHPKHNEELEKPMFENLIQF